MKNGIILALLGIGVGCAAPAIPEGKGSSENHLNVVSTALWPGAQIPVCWDKSQLSLDRYPNKDLASDLDASFAEKKKLVQQIAESQWGARTPIQYVGWKDCAANDTKSVRIVAIDSVFQSSCGSAGQPCADGLGTAGAGKHLFLNFGFGDEFLYLSRLKALQNQGTDVSKMVIDAMPGSDGLYFIPQYCLDALSNPWFTGSDTAAQNRDINDPKALADASAIIAQCTQANALHELGHLAGFAHEQYRTDDKAAQSTCRKLIRDRGLQDDFPDVQKSAPEALGDDPLGVFDLESIMSYCRTDNSATLTAEDVELATRVYSGGGGGNDGADGADGIGTSGGIGGKGGKGGKAD